MRERPPHLCRYALIFHDSPTTSQPWSRFWAGLASEAETINASGSADLPVLRDRRAPRYRRLPAAGQRDPAQAFAGLAFTSTPAKGLIDTPVLSHPKLPRVATHDEKWMPGIKGVAPEPWAFLARALDEIAARGGRRTAILTEVGDPHDYLALVLPWAAQRGLEVPRKWVQQAHPALGPMGGAGHRDAV